MRATHDIWFTQAADFVGGHQATLSWLMSAAGLIATIETTLQAALWETVSIASELDVWTKEKSPAQTLLTQ